MAARLGTSAYAAHQVAMNVMNLSFSFGDGMQVASVALCGRSLGEKRPDLAVMYGTICQRIGNMISIVLSILYLLLGNWYFHLYFVEEDIIAMGARIMQVMTVIVLLQISQVIYMGCLRGAEMWCSPPVLRLSVSPSSARPVRTCSAMYWRSELSVSGSESCATRS